MMKGYRAILIDPFNHTITDVEYSGNWRDIYGLIQCNTFTTLAINDAGDVIFVDDEGLFKSDQRFFTVEGYPQPLAGRGLVLGTDEEGESVEPKTQVADLRGIIGWVRPDLELDEVKTTEGVVDHPVLGRVPMISIDPIFRTGKKEPGDK